MGNFIRLPALAEKSFRISETSLVHGKLSACPHWEKKVLGAHKPAWSMWEIIYLPALSKKVLGFHKPAWYIGNYPSARTVRKKC